MTPDTTEAARMLSEGLSSVLSDAEREHATVQAAYVAEGLRQFADEAQEPGEVAVRLCHTICRMLAEIQRTPLMSVSDFCEQNMTAYGLAAGYLAGVYALPSVESAPAADAPDAEVVQIGQYL